MPSVAASTTIAPAIGRRATTTIRYLARLQQKGLPTLDLHWATAGALLRFATYVERHIEDLFVGALRGKYHFSPAARVEPALNINTNQLARRVVLSGRDYVDWLPYGRTKERAEVFFVGGRPFTALSNTDEQALQQLLWIRNALAHESEFAVRNFRKKVVAGQVLPPRQTTPVGYLMGTHAGTQTRLDYHLTRVVVAFRSLCT